MKPNTEVSQDVVADHRRLVEAYEAGDLPRALQVIVDHNEHSKQTCRRAIESAGGQI